MLQFLYSDLYTLLSLTAPIEATPRRSLKIGESMYSITDKYIKDKCITITRPSGNNCYLELPGTVVSLRPIYHDTAIELLLENRSIVTIYGGFWYEGTSLATDLSKWMVSLDIDRSTYFTTDDVVTAYHLSGTYAM